ncbi:HlyD family type I secretion periplasmic adaptor subunit [Yersinia enterocolitica]|uniref:HlyD family type I secretion periplasmic adaptor subunit n=1 Tax=Yersinia enterocolitica TaxID=630 RepID=UPI0005EA50AC|nr:HlyD family type I secretion periplasmic adaptor subunit [Yersinia enterocolitica]EKN3754627.1 HlyD family type I secretion periplasmic adaptor subunit [Yersinia enterocolitica]EKN3795927.1 HlyD family type I secretion periplasmic adaptor subunit [Yersinia enterocolitica]EKN3876534.1 HlyD family type I secretion periplasmic adaptor subunit [Yersinia enterocolitica]EKN4044333.1 HlyD family type I secretion periplasmic adaptor subunit [Yersinia enterocolitica]EKN4174059.1 HlyD family type I s
MKLMQFWAKLAIFDGLKKRWQRHHAAKRTRDEYDFLPAYLDIVERPVAPLARRTAWFLALTLLLVLVWSIAGRLDIHASANGKVIVAEHSKIIQSLEPGVVVAINVHDGDRVVAGQVLLELNPIGVDAEVNNINQQLMHRSLEAARMSALLTDAPLTNFIYPDNSPENLVMTAKSLLTKEYDEVNAELARQDSERAVNQAYIQAGSTNITHHQALMKNIHQRLQALQTLVKSRAIAEAEVLIQEREWLNASAEGNRLESEQTVLRAKMRNLAQVRLHYLAEKKRSYQEQLNKAHEVINQLKQELVKLTEKQRQQTLRAPVDGVIQQSTVHTLGGVVTSAQPLMVLVPESHQLELDVMILNKDIGFVLPGQAVEVKIDSFPYTRFGTLSGEVKHISLDAMEDQQQGLVFPARIRLDSDTLTVEGKPVRLSAGMSVSAEIKTGRRRVIDYLLSPLQQYQSEAMRER